MELQKWLRQMRVIRLSDSEILRKLEERYAIKSVRCNKYPNLVLFSYNQIESPFEEKIVQESRGVILDADKNWELVCARFPKFFNYGESLAAPIDWSTAEVQEKLDGSLITLFCYNGEWLVATTGSPGASGNVNHPSTSHMTFADLFWSVASNQNLHLRPHKDDDKFCYSFELTSKYNKVVVQHSEPKITLLCVYDRTTNQEYMGDDHRLELGNGIDKVKSYKLSSFDEIVKTFETMDPCKQEGYVVVDAARNRVKVKHPGYVALHRLKSSFSPRNILEIIRTGEHPEILSYFPEWTKEFNEIKEKYDNLVYNLGSIYLQYSFIENQKDFALAIKDVPGKAALFAIRRFPGMTIKKYLAETNIYGLMELLEMK